METMSREQLQAWLQNHVAEVLEMKAEEIDLERPLGEQGLDSVDAVGLTGELEDLLDRELEPTLAFEYPSINALAKYLSP